MAEKSEAPLEVGQTIAVKGIMVEVTGISVIPALDNSWYVQVTHCDGDIAAHQCNGDGEITHHDLPR